MAQVGGNSVHAGPSAAFRAAGVRVQDRVSMVLPLVIVALHGIIINVAAAAALHSVLAAEYVEVAENNAGEI